MEILAKIMIVLLWVWFIYQIASGILKYYNTKKGDKREYTIYIATENVDIRILELSQKTVLKLLMKHYFEWDKKIVVKDSSTPEYVYIERENGITYPSKTANSIEDYLKKQLSLGTSMEIRNKKEGRYLIEIYKLNR